MDDVASDNGALRGLPVHTAKINPQADDHGVLVASKSSLLLTYDLDANHLFVR